MNAIHKRFVNRKESHIDTIVLVLGELSASFYWEILKGRYHRRNFHLQGDFESLYDLERDCPVLPEIKTAEKIFINFQNSIKNIDWRRYRTGLNRHRRNRPGKQDRTKQAHFKNIFKAVLFLPFISKFHNELQNNFIKIRPILYGSKPRHRLYSLPQLKPR